MKFETHNTQIFRLLEEAVQLKEDSNIPCLVRYTEKGLVGEYNKKYFIGEEDNNPFVCYKLDSDGEVELPEVAIYRTYLPYYCFEIVGTLVDTHSAEWMIYQAMQGKKGIHPDITRPVHYDGECMTMDGDEKPIRVAPSLFISSYPNGWEIYDKEQKFANVKEGDSIMCSDGRIRIVDKVGKKPDKSNGRLWFNLQVEDWGLRTFYFDGTLQVPERELRFTLEYVCEPEPYPKFVVVPITTSGNVRQAYNEDGTIDDEQFQLLPNGSWDGTEMFISFGALDSHTRKLVESLLKAQEEEK